MVTPGIFPLVFPGSFQPIADLAALGPPAGDALYDRIMGGIEPELTAARLPGLAERYKGETPAARRARTGRYARAAAECERQLDTYIEGLLRMAHAQGRAAAGSQEESGCRDDASVLRSLEADIARSRV